MLLEKLRQLREIYEVNDVIKNFYKNNRVFRIICIIEILLLSIGMIKCFQKDKSFELRTSQFQISNENISEESGTESELMSAMTGISSGVYDVIVTYTSDCTPNEESYSPNDWGGVYSYVICKQSSSYFAK